jgi:hypothetical protein
MICTCSQCTSTDEDEVQEEDEEGYLTAEYYATRPVTDLMAALASIAAESERRQTQSLAAWFGENKKGL